MQIGVDCFKDEQLYSMVYSNNRMGICDIEGKNNVIVYDTEEDDYLEEYFDMIIDAFSLSKEDGDDEHVNYLKAHLANWNVFSVSEEKIQIILKEICKDRYLSNKNLFEERVFIPELLDSEELANTHILKNLTWEDFCLQIKHINRFFSANINNKQLEQLFNTMEVTIEKSKLTLYRSRICDEKHFGEGYIPDDMGIPPVYKIKGGRTNPEGVGCLYLSDTEETTYHEVRARDYDRVCVGVFEQIDDLNIIDFSAIDKIGPFSSIDIVWFATNISIIKKIGKEIAKPVRRFDSQLDYVPTQFLCAYIKYLGFDGIKFNSTLKKGGINYAIFDEKKFRCTKTKVREIKNVKYSIV